MYILRGSIKIGDSIEFLYTPILTLLNPNYRYDDNMTELKKEDLADTIKVERLTNTKYSVSINTYREYNRYINTYRISNHKEYNMIRIIGNKYANYNLSRDILYLLSGDNIIIKGLAETNKFLSELDNCRHIVDEVRENHTDLLGIKTYNGLLSKEYIYFSVAYCDNCGELNVVTNHNMKPTKDGKIMCNKCYDSRYFICDKCHEIVSVNEMCSCNNKERTYGLDLFVKCFNENNIYMLQKNTNSKTKLSYNNNVYDVNKYSCGSNFEDVFLVTDVKTTNKIILVADIIKAKLNIEGNNFYFSYAIHEEKYITYSILKKLHLIYENASNNGKIINEVHESFKFSNGKPIVFLYPLFKEKINIQKFVELIVKIIPMTFEEIYNYVLNIEIEKMY